MINGKYYSRNIVRDSLTQIYSQGENVDIYYNPGNPNDMMTTVEMTEFDSLFIPKVIFFAAALAVVLFLLNSK